MAFFQKLYNFHVVSCCNLQNWQKYRGGSCSNLFHVALPAKLKAFFFLQKWFILFPEYPYRGLSPSPWSVSFPVVCVPTDHQPPTTNYRPPTTNHQNNFSHSLHFRVRITPHHFRTEISTSVFKAKFLE